MVTQLAGSVEELEAQRGVLDQRIRALAERKKADREEEEREQSRREAEQARSELPSVLASATEQREAFLSHYRDACLALGNYVELTTRAGHLTNNLMTIFGILPEDRNAVQALQLGNRPREILSGLTPDVDAGWQMTFPVTPMHDKFKTR